MSTWINAIGEKMEYDDSYEEKTEYLARTKCPCNGYLSGCEECKQEKGNNPMREKYDYECDTPPGTCTKDKANIAASSAQVIGSNLTIAGPEMVAEDERKYVARRALDTIEFKILQLRDKFKIDFDWRPKTVQEADTRLRAGLFTIRDADKKEVRPYPYMGLQDVFSWRGPDDQADVKGYDDAVEKFAAFYAPILDEIRIFDPKDSLESLRKIEAYDVG